MANIKLFSDWNGETVQLDGIFPIENAKFAAMFPGVKGRRSDGFDKYVGYKPGTREVLPLTRWIEFKKNPSRHVCNAKCMSGRMNGVCECSCGGKNHGAGGFIAIAA